MDKSVNEVNGCNENEPIENEVDICERDRENGRLRDREWKGTSTRRRVEWETRAPVRKCRQV